MIPTAHRSKKRLQQQQQQEGITTATTSSSSFSQDVKQNGGVVAASASFDNVVVMDHGVNNNKLPPLPDTAEGNRLRKIRRRESGNHCSNNHHHYNNNGTASMPNEPTANANFSSSRGTSGATINRNIDATSSAGDHVVAGGTSVSDQDDDEDPEMMPSIASAAAATVTTTTTTTTTTTAAAAAAAASVVVPKEDEDFLDTGIYGPCKDNSSSSSTFIATAATTAQKADNNDNSNDNNDNNDSCQQDADSTTTSRDYYFDSYAHHAIHEEMLKDEVRTKTYEMAICQNGHLFQDKIVLDVGCGTGILSMFASQAGAKHVYAVDCSTILHQAREIVQRNGFGPDKITCIQGKVEEIELPVEHVDIIVSEWMGYFLLYESMLDTVIYARDKWLVPGGVVFPDKAVMYLTAMEDGNVKRERIDFWKDVYGFDMTPIQEIALREPVVDVVDAKALVTDSVPILRLDILTCTKEDLAFTSKFRLQAQRNDYVHGLVAYFECAFTQIHKPIGFSTAPFARYTHWKQTMFYLSDAITICAGETLEGEITCKPNKRNRRDLDIAINVNFNGRHSHIQNKTMDYRLR